MQEKELFKGKNNNQQRKKNNYIMQEKELFKGRNNNQQRKNNNISTMICKYNVMVTYFPLVPLNTQTHTL